MQEAEEDGHRRSLGSICQDQAARLQGQEDREEEEDHDQERQPEPLLQRVVRVRGGRKPTEQGGPKHIPSKTQNTNTNYKKRRHKYIPSINKNTNTKYK